MNGGAFDPLPGLEDRGVGQKQCQVIQKADGYGYSQVTAKSKERFAFRALPLRPKRRSLPRKMMNARVRSFGTKPLRLLAKRETEYARINRNGPSGICPHRDKKPLARNGT